MKQILLEIGTEEIPARFIPDGIKTLKENIAALLRSENIDFGDIFGYATPRRLAVFIENVSDIQKKSRKEVLGPPKKISFNAKGSPTPAASGFARSLNISTKELIIVKTDRGEYIAANIEEPERKTKDILEAALPKLITSLHFPKTMRWGNGKIRFVRPIRWITAIFDNKKISFNIDGIKSSNITRGHRFLSPGSFKINDPSSYTQTLLTNFVIADPIKRREAILKGINKLESASNFKIIEDEELLSTVTFLVEYPTVILGSFDPEYLLLPKELLITVMKIHQKYFSVADEKGDLLPNFLLVSNSKPENNETVRRGAERVLKARLEDAKFYYNEDQKKPLKDYIENLKNVTFQEKLGSMFQKTERISLISTFLADLLEVRDKETLLRAVMLSKADLVTGIVREFPEMQGYIGMNYARNSGENEDVALSINEHYKPRFSDDDLPSGDISSIISIADKIDNIAAFFSIGLIPTGSEDPFALRRQAIGIINILQNNDYPVTLDLLIDKALEGFKDHLPENKELNTEILIFFHQRLEMILLNDGYSYDLVDAVLSVQSLQMIPPGAPESSASMKTLKTRIDALSLLKKEKGFSGLLTAAKRVYNILSKTERVELREDLLSDIAEKELLNTAQKVRKKLSVPDYISMLDLTKPVNNFFDSVLVMDKNPEIKQNRLALLSYIMDLFNSLGDFSKITD